MRSRLFRALRALSLLLGLLVLIAAAVAAWLWQRQGIDDWSGYEGATIDVDAYGVPTITAPDWAAVIQAQGYVTAANRLWQMDLMRRASSGRLAEWFGDKALPLDQRRWAEDWPGAAKFMAENLPADQRADCDAFAAGVNQFIADRPWGWGLEYVILRVRPSPWRCEDSLSLLINMAETLSTTSDDDALTWPWRQALGEEWAAFLFPLDHPWNVPLIGENPRRLKVPDQPLPGGRPPADAPVGQEAEGFVPGSNNWAWRGETGTFLANDPHLSFSVPALWFLVRLRVADGPMAPPRGWVVGAAIPGTPGVVLGRNPGLAWAFTNSMEDVDDLLLERLSEDGTRYLAALEPSEDGAEPQEVWAEIQRRPYTIHVRGAADVTGVALFTSRGPLAQREELGGAWASRQWLPLQRDPALAGLAMLPMAKSLSLAEAEAALDGFRYPAQNVVMATTTGDLAWRLSGTGVQRDGDVDRPVDALEGAWKGLEAPSTRLRLEIPADAPGPVFIATANQRVWVDGQTHNFGGDRRAARIREVLASRDDLSAADMERLQTDTTSRYHQIILTWAASRFLPTDPSQSARLDRWLAWDGDAAKDVLSFTEAVVAAETLEQALLGAVRRSLPAAQRDLPYVWNRSDASVLAVLGVTALDARGPAAPAVTRDHFARFGLAEAEVASQVVAAASAPRPLWPEQNRFTNQHPLAARVPLLGPLFLVDEPPQIGHAALVRVERPTGGASLRFVWSMRDPETSSWLIPIGESGHIRSPHYKDMQALWVADQRLPVFDDAHDWGFGP